MKDIAENSIRYMVTIKCRVTGHLADKPTRGQSTCSEVIRIYLRKDNLLYTAKTWPTQGRIYRQLTCHFRLESVNIGTSNVVC